jgi:hypothetical protein
MQNRATTSQAPQVPAPPADLGTEIRQQVEEQLRMAEEAVANARERAEIAGEQGRPQGRGPGGGRGEAFTMMPPAMPPHVPAEAVILGLGFFAMVVLIVIGYPIARAWGRRMDRKSVAPAIGPDVTRQLSRIEQAVDAMSIEVERISEAQRYMAKLQAERVAERAGLPRGAGMS